MTLFQLSDIFASISFPRNLSSVSTIGITNKEFFRVVDVDLILLEKFLEKSCDYANIRITIEYFWPTLCRYVRSVAISSNKRNIVINKEIYVVLRKLHTIEDLFSTNSVF